MDSHLELMQELQSIKSSLKLIDARLNNASAERAARFRQCTAEIRAWISQWLGAIVLIQSTLLSIFLIALLD
ncbi:hypothetical protein [Massilia cavernae]|uniref:Uncharacterized protein n=1 Tax=Massilia cavernae TaxID=2320864 RepID=A0A418Y608_9BURK|nr:hypothetical protein [Massilia cavernae]RJG22544.1 hypothetical protein D3872_05250 [Massilia cavernae]